MSRLALICGFTIMLLWGAVSLAETPPKEQRKTKEIPLNEIWAYKMLGTQDVRELEPKADAQLLEKLAESKPPAEREEWIRDELTRRFDNVKILRALDHRPKKGETTGEAFVVRGLGKDALAHAASIFTSAEERKSSFPSDTDLSLVFYAYSSGRYVRLDSVERWSNVITVRYQFVSHVTMEVTRHFALIPLGKLEAGTYHVRIERVQSPDETGLPVEQAMESQQLVGGSTSFVVQKE